MGAPRGADFFLTPLGAGREHADGTWIGWFLQAVNTYLLYRKAHSRQKHIMKQLLERGAQPCHCVHTLHQGGCLPDSECSKRERLLCWLTRSD